MKQTNKTLIIAALFFVGALSSGCSVLNDEISTTPLPQDGHTVTLTTQVSFSAPSTKALDASGVKTFAVGDQMAVFYMDTEEEMRKAVTLKLTAENISADGKTANFTVTLTEPQPRSYVRFIYPAAMASVDGYNEASLVGIDADNDRLNRGTFNIDALLTQNGTLKSISDGLDLCYYDGRLTEEGELPDSPKLQNQLAICQFTIKNADGSSDITSSISKLVINDGVHVYTVDRIPAPGPIYVAMMTVYSRRTVRFYAVTDGNEIYEKCVTGKEISRGKMYPFSLRMTMAGKDFLFGDAGIPAMPQKIANAIGISVESLTEKENQDYIFQNPQVIARWPGAENSRTNPDTDESDDDADLLIGDADDDILFGQGNDDILFGDSSFKDIVGWLNIAGGEFSVSNYATALGAMPVSTLNEGLADREKETDGSDFIYGGMGQDRLFGLGGADVLHGDGGDDMLLGGSGDDTLDGGKGNDYLCGGDGKDNISGGDGMDIIRYSSDDAIDGGNGIDVLCGSGEDASLAGLTNVSQVEIFLKFLKASGEFDDIDDLNLTSLSMLSEQLGMSFDQDEEKVVLTVSYNTQWKDIVTCENGMKAITFTCESFTLILETSLYVTGNPANGDQEITLSTKNPEDPE